MKKINQLIFVVITVILLFLLSFHQVRLANEQGDPLGLLNSNAPILENHDSINNDDSPINGMQASSFSTVVILNPAPSNDEIICSTHPLLSVYLHDPYARTWTIIFYDASNDGEIGRVNDIMTDTRASVEWKGLFYGLEYRWYANATDGMNQKQSGIFNFSVDINVPSYHLEQEIYWGEGENVNGKSIITNPEGNIYQAGTLKNGPHGNDDMYVVKFDTQGDEEWNKIIGGANYDMANDIARDSEGNAYLVGTYNFIPGHSDHKICLVKLDDQGNQKWIHNYSSGTYGDGIQIDKEDNIYLLGWSSLTYNILLLKYDSEGNLIWDRQWSGAGNDITCGPAIAGDDEGNVYIAGATTSAGKGGYDVLLIKFNSSGAESWNRTWGGVEDDQAYSLAVDGENNIYIAGDTESFLVNGDKTQFLAKYDGEGDLMWNRTCSGMEGATCRSIITDSEDTIYMTGCNYQSFSERYVYLLMYDNQGNELWQTKWGPSSDITGYSLAFTTKEDILISGKVKSFGSHVDDFFIIRYKKDIVSSDSQFSLLEQNIRDSLAYNIQFYNDLEAQGEQGYYPTIHPPSIHATFYAISILNYLGELDHANATELVAYLMSHYDNEGGIFSDFYSDRYLDTDLDKDQPPPLTSQLEINCYAVLTLEILGELGQIDSQKMRTFIWSCYHPLEGGFLGLPYDVSLEDELSFPTADNTYFAVKALNALGTDWGTHSSEENKIKLFLASLQCSDPGIYLGGFYNEKDDLFNSLVIYETNLLASYYCLATLYSFNALSYINAENLGTYLTYLYNVEGSYFVICPNHRYFDTNKTNPNIQATALGLIVSHLADYSINVNGVTNYLLTHRNSRGIWDKSTMIPYHELVYTYQILRALSEAGEINLLTADAKEEIANATDQFYFYNGYSLLSSDYTTQERLNTLVNAYDHYYDLQAINELDIADIFAQIKNSFLKFPSVNVYQFYSYIIFSEGEEYYHTHPFEYETTGTHERIYEFNAYKNPRAIYEALNTLSKSGKLGAFESQTGVGMNEILNSLLACQFIEVGYSNSGGFLPDGLKVYFSPELRNIYIYPEHAYYVIKALELLADYLELGDITALNFDQAQLASYVLSMKVETPTEIYFQPPYGGDSLEVLETTYQCIYILNAIHQLSLDVPKVKNFVESHLTYSNIKELYYCYKLDGILELNLEYNISSIRDLLQDTFSPTLHEFYLTPQKDQIDQRALFWVIEMGYDIGFLTEDMIAPRIYLELPLDNKYQGDSCPILKMYVDESNLQQISYSLSNDTQCIFQSISKEDLENINGLWKFEGYISEGLWKNFGNGTVILTINASDKNGNEACSSILLKKELSMPSLIIEHPNNASLHGILAPTFQLNIEGKILDSYWYTLNNSIKMMQSPVFKNFSALEGSISQSLWNQFGNGSISLSFTILNEVGGKVVKTIQIRKDNIIPIINIHSPNLEGDVNPIYHEQAPFYNITITDWNLDAVWYTLSDNANIFPLAKHDFTGNIDQEAWNHYENANITITFHSIDTARNYYEKSLIVEKVIKTSARGGSGEKKGNKNNIPENNTSPNSSLERAGNFPLSTMVLLGLFSGPGAMIISSVFIRKKFLKEIKHP